MSGGHSDTAPPDPIPNSVVKRISGDGSVGFPYARVAHRQASIKTSPLYAGFVVSDIKKIVQLLLQRHPIHWTSLWVPF